MIADLIAVLAAIQVAGTDPLSAFPTAEPSSIGSPAAEEAYRALALAWASRLTTRRQRDLMLRIIAEHTTPQGTDWAAARSLYVEERAQLVAKEDAELLPWRAAQLNRAIRRERGAISVTTTCETRGSRFGYYSETTCTTTSD